MDMYIITRSTQIWYKHHQTLECPSVRLSRRSTTVAADGFAAEVGLEPTADIVDGCY